MKLKDIIGSMASKFAALALALVCAGNVWGAETTTIQNAAGEDITVYVVADGFYQNAATYADAKDFYITSKAGLEYFRDLVNGKKSVTDDYMEKGFYSAAGFHGQFYSYNLFSGKTVHLCADIDLENSTWEPIGYVHAYTDAEKAAYYVETTENFGSASAKTYFYGNFDGQNHKISNIRIENSDTNTKGEYGLFGRIGGDGAGQSFSNLTLETVSASVNGWYVGAIVGNGGTNTTTFDNCHVIGDINISSNASGAFVGGIVGVATSTIDGCSVGGNTGSTIQGSTVGGLAGTSTRTTKGNAKTITGSTVTGVTVKSEDNGGQAGGLVGKATNPVTVTGNTVHDVTVSAEAGTADVLVGGVGGDVTASSNTTDTNVTVISDPYAAYVKVADGFYQNAATYAASTDFYITNLNGLKFFRDLVNGDADVCAGYPELPANRTIHAFSGKTVHLIADIDLGNELWEPIGYAYQTNERLQFEGSFDGGIYDAEGNLTGTHTIANLKVAISSGKYYAGLFGVYHASQNSTLKNLTLNGVNITSGQSAQGVGAFVGSAKNAQNGVTLENLHVIGSVNIVGATSYVGGIVGDGRCTIKNCSVAAGGTIKGTFNVGGISGGILTRSTGMYNCAVADVTVQATAYNYGLGALAGFSSALTVSNCTVSAVTVKCDASSYAGSGMVGLLVGFANSTSAYTILSDNTVINATATEYQTPITTQIGACNADYSIVGSNITFDESGKVKGGIFENIPASAIASGYVTADNPNTETNVSYPLTIGGPFVAVIYDSDTGKFKQGFGTLAAALSGAADGETITLISGPDKAIPAKGEVTGGKTVTITGTAKFDWAPGWLFVGRGANAGDGTLIFKDATITRSSDQASYGLHISGKNKSSATTNYGTLIITNSTIECDVLINKGSITVYGKDPSVDVPDFEVFNGWGVGGRPASESVSGEHETATFTATDGAYIRLANHNGQGNGYEGNAVMSILNGSKFEYTGASFANGDNCTDGATGVINVDATSLLKMKAFQNLDNGNSSVVIDATGASGSSKVIDLSGTKSLEGYVTVNNLVAPMMAIYDADGDVTLMSVAAIVNDSSDALVGRYETLAEAVEAYQDGYTIVVVDKTQTIPEGWMFKESGNVTTLVRAVAQIGDTVYNSLDKAIAAAQEGDTITLLADCETGGQYTLTNPLVLNADNVTLDLNGKTITATGNFSFLISGDNDVVKNGTIQAGANTGKQTGINSYAIVVNGCDGVKLTGLTVNGGISVGGSTGETPNAAAATNVVIEDCTVTSGDFYAVCAQQNSTVTITSGTYTADTRSTYSGVLQGTFAGTDGPKGTISVTGGTFNGNITNNNEGDIVISGGNFSAQVPEKYCAAGYEPTTTVDENGKYTVKTQEGVVVRNITKNIAYTTLADAISAASAGDTVTLLTDVTTTEVVEIAKSITLDGNGHALNTSATRGIWIDSGNVDVAIKNLTIPKNAKVERAIQVNPDCDDVKLTIDNVTATATVYTVNVCDDVVNLDLTIKDSNLTGWGVVNLWGDNGTVVIEGSTLTGINDKSYNADGWNDFGVIVVEGDTTGQTEDHAFAYDITVNNTAIVVDSTTGNGQTAIVYNNQSVENAVTLESCTVELKNENCSFLCDDGADSVTKLKGTTVYGTQDIPVLPEGYCYVEDSAGYQVVTKAVVQVMHGESVVGTYGTLASAINIAQNGDTVKLLDHVYLTQMYTVPNGKNITLDLAGYNISAIDGDWTAGDMLLCVAYGASLTVEDSSDDDSGRIDATQSEILLGAIKMTNKGDNSANGTSTLVVNGGTIAGKYYGISGNGTRHGTSVTVNGGEVSATDEAEGIGIYQPQNGTLAITGGAISGATAVYVKSGDVAISGGDFWGEGADTAYNASGNGANPTGQALVIDSCGYPGGAPVVAITGGVFGSYYCDSDIGSYASGTGNEAVAGFVSGGEFASELPEEYCAAGYIPAENDSDTATYDYTVKPGAYVAKVIGETYVKIAANITEPSADVYLDMWRFWGMEGMVDASGNECPQYVAITDDTMYRDSCHESEEEAEAWVSAKYLYDNYLAPGKELYADQTKYLRQIGVGVKARYETFAEALDAAQDGDTVQLLDDISLTERLFVNAGATPAYAGSNNRYATTSEDKALTLDLNGKNITSSSNIALAGGSLNITGTGTISTTGSGLAPIEVRGTGDLANKRTLTIGDGVTLSGDYGLNVFGSNDAQKNIIDVTVNGTVNGTLFVLGNLKNTENAINIVVNGTVAAKAGTSEDVNVGIALNGNANVTVNNGATVSGDSGIEVRAGNLTVKGGTISATSQEYSYKPNGSGSTTKGAAIAVAQHSTLLPTTATLNGGTLSGTKQIAVTDVNGNMDAVTVKAMQGYTQSSAIPDDYKWVKTEAEGEEYKLVPKSYVAQIGTTKYESLAEAVAAVKAAASGERTTVTLLTNTTEVIEIDFTYPILIDGQGFGISQAAASAHTGIKITAPHADVIIQNATVGNANVGRAVNILGAEGVTLLIKDSALYGNYYPLNVYPNGAAGVDNENITVTNSVIAGPCALNLWGTNGVVTVVDSTLSATNTWAHSSGADGNDFGVIVLEGLTGTPGANGYNIEIKGSTIEAAQTTGNMEHIVLFNPNSQGNTVKLDDCVISRNGDTTHHPVIDEEANTSGNSLYVRNTTDAATSAIPVLPDGYAYANADSEGWRLVIKPVVAVIAADGVTTNGVYGTLEAAYDAASAGETITLLADITYGADRSVPVWDKAVNIDLGGHTLTTNSEVGKNLGNGGYTAAAICFSIPAASAGSVTISNGKIVTAYGAGVYADDPGLTLTLSDLTIEAATVGTQSTAEYSAAVRVTGGAKVIIESGTYSGAYAIAASNSGADFEINGGTFTGDIFFSGYTGSGKTKSVTITGGKFNGGFVNADKGTLAISGGVFKNSPANVEGVVIKNGYEVVANTDAETKEAYPYMIGEKPLEVIAAADGTAKFSYTPAGYTCQKSVDGGEWVNVNEMHIVDSDSELPVSGKSKTYKFQFVKDGEAAISVSNTVGILHVADSQKNKTTIIGVPWFALGEKITVDSLVYLGNREAGDKISAYDSNAKRYWTWELKQGENGRLAWESVYSTTTESTAEAPAANTFELKRGQGVFLVRKDPSEPIYLVGRAAEDGEVVSGGKSALSAAATSGKDGGQSWNLVASPSVEALDINDNKKFPAPSDDGCDRIVVLTSGAPLNFTYKDGKWGYVKVVVDEKSRGVPTRVTENVSIPAGIGFWYLNSGAAREIKW